MKNDIYTQRERGDRQQRASLQTPAAAPATNVWVASLRRQRIQNAFSLLLILSVAGLIIFIAFQQQQVGETPVPPLGEPVQPAVSPRPALTQSVQVRPLAPLPGEDARTGLMLDALVRTTPLNVGAGNHPLHVDWLKAATRHVLLAEQAQQEDDLQRALDEYASAAHIFPQLQGVHGAMGLIHMQREEFDAAANAFTDAIRVDGMSARLANNLAIAALRMDDYERAVAALRNAISVQPTYAPAYYNLAIAYARMQKEEQALSSFRAYLQRSPDDLDSLLSFSALLIEAEDWQGAAELLALADRMAPGTPPILFRLAQAQAQTGQLREALNALDRATDRVDARHALRWIARREFDPLRDQPAFQRLLESLGE